jgi:uncharacterized protein (TIGR03086 family)
VTALVGGVGLLARAIDYTLGGLDLVTPASLSRPTPCAAWDLRALLDHLDDSLLALHEAAVLGRVYPEEGDYQSADPVTRVRDRATRLLGAWPRTEVEVGHLELSAAVVTTTGAFEVAVHGWDVTRTCGADRPIPTALAEEMLDLSPLLVTAEDRPTRFAPPTTARRGAPAGDRLVAFLGRLP